MRAQRRAKQHEYNSMPCICKWMLMVVFIVMTISSIKALQAAALTSKTNAVDHAEENLQEKKSNAEHKIKARMMWFTMQNTQPQVVYNSTIPETLESAPEAEQAGNASYDETDNNYYDDSEAVNGAHGKDVLYGHYEIVVGDAGIASMHTAVTHYDTVVMLDRTNIGPSHIALPNGRCRDNPQELALKHDCTAHSVMFTPGPNTIRPLFIYTDTWCSSAQFLPDGTLLQTGGDFEGKSKIRRLVPCPASDSSCDWYEYPDISLQDPRWYATNQLLPDGRVIIIGGRSVFTYEFFPRPQGQGSFYLKFLADTSNFEADNLYPFVHLLPDGNLYIFANRDSILLDYKTNKVLRNYPTIPGNPRNYPSAGSSVLLPLDGPTDDFTTAEVLVCGGAQLGAFAQPAKQLPCSDTCGRITVTSPNPSWAMETMPVRRCMGDMILLPNRDVVIINGAQDGSQGWGDASNPTLNPVIYRPRAYPQARFVLQPAGTIARLYHSTANLLSDGSVLIAGSNTHQFYTFNGVFPTELRVEKWLPFYFNKPYLSRKPTIVTSPIRLTHGLSFDVTVSCQQPPSSIEINLISSYFSTHSYSQGQRLLRLKTMHPIQVGKNLYKVTTMGPPNANIAPPSYYMMFAVVSSVPSSAKWVQLVSH